MDKGKKPSFARCPHAEVDLLVIAGEHSGDEHAARLVEDLLIDQPNTTVAAIGGTELEKAGAHLLYNPLENAVVGLIEVLKHFDYLKALFETTLDWIEAQKPKVVCFVDYPGFNLRIAKRLFERGISNKAGGDVRLVFYISPQIWAWKAKRRFTMAKHLDALATIFPFEVACYEDTDLDTQFVGHPFTAINYKLPVSYDARGKLLLLPGSRATPVSRIFPVMVESYYLLKQKMPELEAMVMYPTEKIKAQLSEVIEAKGRMEDFDLLPNSERFSARAVITSSGTISLKCALAAIPGLLVYKTNALSYLMAKFLVKIRQIGIANIILGEQIHPEFLQNAMQPERLAEALLDKMDNSTHLQRVQSMSKDLFSALKVEGSETAHAWLYHQLKTAKKA